MTSRLGSGRGYLLVDHSDSPGIPDWMAPKIAATGGIVVPANTKLETDTWTCAHCNAIVVKNPQRLRPREVCRNCMQVVCDEHSLWCEPYEKLAEAIAAGQFHKLPSSPLIIPGHPL